MYKSISLGVLFLFTTAFSSPSGELGANFYVKGVKDANGYIHMSLPWKGDFWPRFTVGVEADQTDKQHWYNGSPVVTAKFHSNSTWMMGNEVVDMVQNTSLYFKPDANGKSYSRRIIGPIPPSAKGDTLVVNVEIAWDQGKSSVKKQYELKFIVE